MPRIQAPTLAEHRRQQTQAILDGAKAILAETGKAPSLAAVGARVGLARSSVYQYFSSSDELLEAVVADLFPSWGRFVGDRVSAESEPGRRIWAYICANVDLFVGSEQAVANALARVVDPSVLLEPMQRFHAELQEPLIEALVAHGESHPREVAGIIDSVILQACRSLGAEHSDDEHSDDEDPRETGTDSAPAPAPAADPKIAAVREEILAMIRRLLGGYLGLVPGSAPDPGNSWSPQRDR
ncbi:TetR/AcrR family transcriptional regulator [Gordonia paraffinivorans]|uniref:TetR/AcrR family transcriptional regulator n=2 Tax=Gordonia paraffinivorans TaxID=175628 RepID=UPI001447A810|nr:TetR/AcrR family transcriptional regulator [Gordonia paraffinivorans]